jgi:hypothetical protein
MLSKLFHPRAPEPAPVERLQFHFNDKLGAPKTLPTLADALATVAAEKNRLRAVVDDGKGLRATGVLRGAIDSITVVQNAAYRDYTDAFARSDLLGAESARSRHSTYTAERRQMMQELTKVEAAEVARNALAGLLTELAR